jgi:NADPH2:quinone reductase
MNREKAVQLDHYGDASVLHMTELNLPSPPAGSVRVRHTAIGVNFVDVYHRTGLYPLGSLPATIGVEAAGIVEAVGEGVTDVRVGQRVAYAGPPVGSYTTARNIPSNRLIPLPDNVADAEVASAMLRGITAHMLFNYVRPLRSCDTLLVHAAAGGLGQVIGQWHRPSGVTLIGTVGSVEKADIAREKGYEHTVQYRRENFVDAVKKLTGGEGVHYAIDGIGGETLLRTLDAVRPFGMVASVGQVAGDTAPLALSELGPARSIALSRPSIFRYMSDIGRYREGALATVQQLQSGLKVDISLTLPLERASEAHRQLEMGKTSGAIILLPSSR